MLWKGMHNVYKVLENHNAEQNYCAMIRQAVSSEPSKNAGVSKLHKTSHKPNKADLLHIIDYVFI